MKRSLIATLVASGALFAVCAPMSSVQAADGVINFMGVIRAPGCDINGNQPGIGNVQTVNLGTPTPAEVTAGGATEAEFQLSLAGGAGCTDGRKVRIMFDTADASAAGNLKLLDADKAANVEISIRNNGNGNTGKIELGTPEVNPQVVTIASGAGVLKYAAKYVEVGGAAGSGSGASRIKYLLSYN